MLYEGGNAYENYICKCTQNRKRRISYERNCFSCIRCSFAVHDIRIIEGEKGLFIAMPSRKNALGEYRDIAHPINPEVRAMFEEAILDAYENAEDVSVEKDA